MIDAIRGPRAWMQSYSLLEKQQVIQILLNKKYNDKITVVLDNGAEVTISLVKVGLESVRIGVEAPRDVPVHKAENVPNAQR